MKKTLIGVLIVMVMSPLAGQEVLDGIVAIVGEEIILRTELQQMTQQYAMQMSIPATDTERFEELKESLLQELIYEKVMLAKAKEDTIEVEDDRVDMELEAQIARLIQQLGSQERLEETFGAPLAKIKRDYREEFRKRLIVRAVREQKAREIKISRREVEQYYETVKDSFPEMPPEAKLRHILLEIRPGGEAHAAAVARMREIQDRLRQGESFEDLATTYSEDEGTAKVGGNLGFVERGTLFPSFEAAAFQLEDGAISDIVESPVGLHLIQLIEKRGDKARLRHILLRLGATTTDEDQVLESITELRNQILGGEDFADVAREHSVDESTRERGGDLSWLPLENLTIPEFKAAIDTLMPGEISMPFKTAFGYHIAKLEDRREARKISLDTDWENIQGQALMVKQEKVLKEWIEDLKKNIYIEIKENK